MYRQNQDNIGSFIEKEFKHEFTYRATKDKWAINQGYEHEIDVGTIPNGSDSFGFNAGDVRFANVKKTVAYVLCDDLEGNAVEQKWLLAKNTVFVK